MTTSTHASLLDGIDRLIEERHLLKHPFYRAWSDGAHSLETLRFYSQQYWHHVAAFPQ